MGPIEAFPASSLNKVTPKLLEGLQLVVELEADALVGLPHLGGGRGSVVVHALAVLERDDLDLTAPREGLADVAEVDLGVSSATMRSTVTPAFAAALLVSSSTRA